MEYLKVNGTEYPAHFCGKQIDREWDGRASKTVTLAMPYAQAVQLFVDGRAGASSGVRPAQVTRRQEQDCSGYCVAGPITDNRDGTLSIKMGSYTQLEQALPGAGGGAGMTRLERESLARIRERLAIFDPGAAEKLAAAAGAQALLHRATRRSGPAAKKTIEALLPELAALLEAAEGAMQ